MPTKRWTCLNLLLLSHSLSLFIRCRICGETGIDSE